MPGKDDGNICREIRKLRQETILLRKEIRELQEQNSRENRNLKAKVTFDSDIEISNDKMRIALNNSRMELSKRQ